MGNKLQQIRASKNMTQQEVSIKTGYTQGQISRWENGHSLSLASATKIAAALEVSIDTLIAEEVQ